MVKVLSRERLIFSKTKMALKKYLNCREDNDVCLFRSKSNGEDPHLTINAVELVIRLVGKECNVKAHPHKFRKYFASSSLHKGGR